jgi:predicted RNA binding protein YcfA (HicA-like mRNA interferase family)
MKLPRDLSGENLVKLLSRFEYAVDRQTGSHIRLTTQVNGEHYVTIPAHDPLTQNRYTECYFKGCCGAFWFDS